MTKEECESKTFPHNQRGRYQDGFYCCDCRQYFNENSPEYRRYELLSKLWMVVHNIGVDYYRKNLLPPEQVKILKNKLDEEQLNKDITIQEIDELIKEAKEFISNMGKHENSASIVVGYDSPLQGEYKVIYEIINEPKQLENK